jgi:hypothetical protein
MPINGSLIILLKVVMLLLEFQPMYCCQMLSKKALIRRIWNQICYVSDISWALLFLLFFLEFGLLGWFYLFYIFLPCELTLPVKIVAKGFKIAKKKLVLKTKLTEYLCYYHASTGLKLSFEIEDIYKVRRNILRYIVIKTLWSSH